jgi:signal transduction histidine kinase
MRLRAGSRTVSAMLVADHAPGNRFGNAEAGCSRARIAAAAADEARRQLERDLHDGAQQRFVSASLWLKRAAEVARGTPAERFVTEAYDQIQHGLDELRDLAGGGHPGPLTEHGLGPALQGLAARSPLPVGVRVTSERVAPAVETAIYFTVAETLTNVARHAQATRAAVTIEVAGGMLTAEIADDGVGGACASGGSGLSGLAERLSRLGGTLSVESPPGGPTRIAARVPLLPDA